MLADHPTMPHSADTAQRSASTCIRDGLTLSHPMLGALGLIHGRLPATRCGPDFSRPPRDVALEISRHRSVDTLRDYVRDADLFWDHAGAGLL
jgi:hypothetical protein